AVSNTSNSLVGSTNLVTKVYFPRIIVPFAAVGAWLVDFAISVCILGVLMAWYGIWPTWQITVAPVLLIGVLLAAAGVGSLLSALTVSYRDFRYVVPFLIQIWMFISPVIFPPTLVPGRWQWLFALNPMSGLIEGF